MTDQMIRGVRGNGAFAQLVDVDQFKGLPACTSCFYSVHIVGYSKKNNGYFILTFISTYFSVWAVFV